MYFWFNSRAVKRNLSIFKFWGIAPLNVHRIDLQSKMVKYILAASVLAKKYLFQFALCQYLKGEQVQDSNPKSTSNLGQSTLVFFIVLITSQV